jgi:uncharacterized protein
MRIVPVVTAALFALLPLGSAEAQVRHHPPAHTKPAEHKPPERKPIEHKPTVAELAAHGDRDAQFQMGQIALSAKGTVKTSAPAVALEWFALAAANGSVPAALLAAEIIEKKGDHLGAAWWWYRAGVLGDHDARTRFLDVFLAGEAGGIGGPEGAQWLADRASAGDNAAQIALGEAYERGTGIPADRDRAESWYLKAALDGNVEGMFRLGRLQIARPALWRAPTKEVVRDQPWAGPVTYPLVMNGVDADDKIPDLGRSVVAAANDVDQKDLSFVRPGMVEGERWLQSAARRGHVDAQYTLGMAYVTGLDLPLDMMDGIGWLQSAARRGQVDALMAVGDFAAKGQGFANKDSVRAWVSYDLAAGLGRKDAEADRDRVAKALTPRQLTRARAIAQDLRDARGM